MSGRLINTCFLGLFGYEVIWKNILIDVECLNVT